MNCEQTSKFFSPFNELICTACSLDYAGKTILDDATQPIKSTGCSFQAGKLFTAFGIKKRRGEQVCFFEVENKN
jgi:hypothetical protein